MELKIIGNPLVEATVNLRNFRKIIQKEYDMEKAVKSSLTIRKNLFPKERLTEVINFIYLGVNWGSIIDLSKDIHKDTINLKLYPVE